MQDSLRGRPATGQRRAGRIPASMAQLAAKAPEGGGLRPPWHGLRPRLTRGIGMLEGLG